jgi:hypothetical protein
MCHFVINGIKSGLWALQTVAHVTGVPCQISCLPNVQPDFTVHVIRKAYSLSLIPETCS